MTDEITSSEPRWDAIRTESLSSSIVRQIKDALFAGKLSPGDFLGSEIAFGQQFGVSRMAARDALRSLSAEGIVEIRMGPKGGAWVAAGNPDRLVDALAIQLRLIGVSPAELLDAQSVLSVVAAELAATCATEEDILRLRVAARAAEDAGDSPDAFTTASLRFHEALISASKNRVLMAQLRALEVVLRPLLVSNTDARVARRVVKSNAALLQAISTGDAETSGKIMRERIAGIRSKILGVTA
ncbi:MAG: FCD domain-containing protein [Thauera sp.]|nr:FCD domain-containing protein [Thauera sp.]